MSRLISLLKGGWSLYSDLLVQSPLVTKAITSGCTSALSDAVTQSTAGYKKKFKMSQTAHAAITALVWGGPLAHYWYKLLFGHLTASIESPVLGLVSQVLLDAIIFSPLTLFGFFTLRALLEGFGWEGVRHKLTTRYFYALVGAWKFWPAANVVSFSLVPLKYRVLYMNVMSLFFSSYLAYINSVKRMTALKMQKKQMKKK